VSLAGLSMPFLDFLILGNAQPQPSLKDSDSGKGWLIFPLMLRMRPKPPPGLPTINTGTPWSDSGPVRSRRLGPPSAGSEPA
jgi:hypothetical protein